MAPFDYPDVPHNRIHGPDGYVDYERFRPWLRDEFLFRCVYCLKREQWGVLRGTYHLEHFLPQAVSPDETLNYENLLYSCAACNAAKGTELIPDPCQWLLSGRVIVHDDGRLEAQTREAARIIRKLGLDDAEYREFRRLWIGIVRLAQRVDPALFRMIMRYPDDLPDLSRLRPPSNSKPGGVDQSCHARRRRGELLETY